MPLVLTEEQELLRETAREFVAERAPIAQLRQLRDERDPSGFSRELWSDMAQLGWAGIPFSEEYGGADLGYTELGIVLEETGRTLAASPLVSSVLLGGSTLLLGGNETQRKEWLTGVCGGETLLALAIQEGPHHSPWNVATRAETDGDGYRLNGAKTFVIDGHVADRLIVAARSAGEQSERDGLTLFCVDASAPGVGLARASMVDGRNAARLTLDGVRAERSEVLGEIGQGAELLDAVLDRGAAGLAAEMLGSLDTAFQKTLAYLKQREQFGVPIGSFQALQHRAARMFVQLELSRSVVLDALQALDGDHPDASAKASLAKAQLSDAAPSIANECVQMHGGIGVTDEEDIGLYLKRARVTQFALGDAAFHRDRYAGMHGY